MSSTILIRNLTKSYKNNLALNNLSLDIDQSGIVGLFGPNGSGKTTLIKILANLLNQYKGEVLINGIKPSYQTKSLVSYLPDCSFLDESWKVSYAVHVFKKFYLDFDETKCLNLLHKFQLNLNQQIKTLSKGNKEKLQTILILCRNAKVYLFDEPIAGVDPASREVIFNLILENYNKDAIVILATHLILDVEEIVDRAIFIQNGFIVFDENVKLFRIANPGINLNDKFREVFRCL